MNKALTYSSFAIVSLVVVVVFVTSKSYSQLAIATVLYSLAAYLAFYLFSRQTPKVQLEKTKIVSPPIDKSTKDKERGQPGIVDVVDIDRRAFLKFVGATGLSFFVFSLLGRRAETLLFDRPMESRTTPGGTGPAEGLPTDGYRISEIDDSEIGYYGFTKLDGSWFIMKEDSQEGSFRYSKGESNFPGNWANREILEYDYFHKVF